jgi:tight adherence protein B
MLWLIGIAGLGLVLVVAGFIVPRLADRSLVEKRLGIKDQQKAERSANQRSSPLGEALDRTLTNRGLGSDLATQLARADMKLTVGEFLAATVIIVVGAGGVAYFLSNNILITVGACVAGFFAPRIYIAIVRGRRLKAFNNMLGDTINLMVNSLRAGYSVMQAMEAVSKEMDAPISTEFGRVVQEQQLGLSLEQALDNMLRRIPSEDLDMMVTAINVQREVGGNLAEVLDAIAYTIRERIRIKGEIKALTAQSRVSGYMITAVPITLSVIIYLINPDFMSLLFTHRCGWLMIGTSIIGIVVGYVLINKIVSIDV